MTCLFFFSTWVLGMDGRPLACTVNTFYLPSLMGEVFNCSILQWGGAGVEPYRPVRSPSQTCLLIYTDPEPEVRSPAQAAFLPPIPATHTL